MEKYWACSCDETTSPRANTIYIWSLDKCEVEFKLRGHRSAVYALCFNTDQSKLATASYDRTARIWDIENEAQLVELQHDISSDRLQLCQVLFLNGDSQILTACSERVFVWDIETTAILITFDINSTYFYCCCYLGSDTILFPRDNRLCCANIVTGDQRIFSEEKEGPVRALTVSPSGDMFATAAERTIRIWTREVFSVISVMEHSTGSNLHSSVTSLRFNPRNDLLAAGCGTGESIVVWDWAIQTIVFRVPNISSCRCINFTADSTKLVCALNANFIVVDIDQGGAIIEETRKFNIEGCNLQYLASQVVLM